MKEESTGKTRREFEDLLSTRLASELTAEGVANDSLEADLLIDEKIDYFREHNQRKCCAKFT